MKIKFVKSNSYLEFNSWDVKKVNVYYGESKLLELSGYPNNCSIVIFSSLNKFLSKTPKQRKDIFERILSKDTRITYGKKSCIQATVNNSYDRRKLIYLGFTVISEYKSHESGNIIHVMQYLT